MGMIDCVRPCDAKSMAPEIFKCFGCGHPSDAFWYGQCELGYDIGVCYDCALRILPHLIRDAVENLRQRSLLHNK